jgi:hypothetical protein
MLQDFLCFSVSEFQGEVGWLYGHSCCLLHSLEELVHFAGEGSGPSHGRGRVE